jgi:hypothetical protein
MYLRVKEGLGQFGPYGDVISHTVEEVVRAIRKLPEGQVCPTPEKEPEHRRRIVEELTKQGFQWFEIENGLRIVGLSPPQQIRPFSPASNLPPQTSMRSTTPGEVRASLINTAQILEERFLKAERSDDLEGMAKAAEEFYDLLGRYPRQGEPMPGRGSMQRQREALSKVREDILRRAPNLGSLVRTIGPWESAQLRGKIGEYVRQRAIAGRARRSGRRR